VTRRGRRGLGETSAPWIYTTRLQKGGALLDDMRQLVRTWSKAPTNGLRDEAIRANILNKGTRGAIPRQGRLLRWRCARRIPGFQSKTQYGT
jgi:bacteriophage exclusion system BrxA-like protein